MTALLSLLCLVVSEPSLEASIRPLATAHKGQIAVAVKNLETGEEFYLNADQVMQTASLIKLAVMVETYWQAHEGKIKLETMLTLTKDDKVQGAGILTDHFSDGARFSLRDAVRLMIRYSDNTATNMVLDQIGIAATGKRMATLGLPETRINAKVFKGSTTTIDPERLKKYQLGSTSARETVKLLELIHNHKIISPEACKLMLGHLRANDDSEMLVRFLPAGTVMAHKTGATNRVRTDAGIMSIPKPGEKKATIPVAICVLTNENQDQRWILENDSQVTIAKIGKAIYDHYAKQPR